MKVPIPIRPVGLALACALGLALLPAASAAAGCRERLESVSARLAEARDLDPSLRRSLETFRSQAEGHCAAGQEASAGAALTSIEMMLDMTARNDAARAQSAAREQASKQALDRDYVAGTWCATRPQNNARELWVFEADGSWRVAPSEFRFEFIRSGGWEEFLAGFDAVSDKQSDRFVVLQGRSAKTYRRGSRGCEKAPPGAP